jgi:hypothetical protein
MVSRRTILQGGIAASSLPLVAGLSVAPLQAAVARALDHPDLYKVLFDHRFAAGRAFGRAAEWRGESVHGFDGDVTNVWYHDLYARWQKGAAAISGMTAHGALFCLEQLAWDVRMRVVYRAEHRYEGHEPLYSWIIAPRSQGPARSPFAGFAARRAAP